MLVFNQKFVNPLVSGPGLFKWWKNWRSKILYSLWAFGFISTIQQLALAGSEKQQELAHSVLTLKAIYLTVMTCYFTKYKDYKRVLREVKDFHR